LTHSAAALLGRRRSDPPDLTSSRSADLGVSAPDDTPPRAETAVRLLRAPRARPARRV